MYNINQLKDKRVLVTGGSGFIGTNLIGDLLDIGAEVLNISNSFPLNKNHSKCFLYCDILDFQRFFKIYNNFQPQFCIHLAARTDLDGKTLDDYKVNTFGTKNLINAINKTECTEKVIFLSSRLVFNIKKTPQNLFDYSPTTKYGESKVMMEQIIKESYISCSWCILRPTSLWGEWFGEPYRNFFNTVLKSRYFHPRGLKIWKSFGYVRNSTFQILNLLCFEEKNFYNKIYFLCDYEPIEVRGFSNLIRICANKKELYTLPLVFLRILAIFGDCLKIIGYKNPPLTTFRLNNLLTNMVYEKYLLNNQIPNLPFSLKQGILNTLDWIYNY